MDSKESTQIQVKARLKLFKEERRFIWYRSISYESQRVSQCSGMSNVLGSVTNK